MAKIMIIDDEPSILTVMGQLLAMENHEVLEVESGECVAELLKTEDVDLIISDVRMNPVDGMQILRSAKETNPGVNVIMVTAYDSTENRRAATEAGAYAYIPKPFHAFEIMQTVSSALAASSK